MTPMPPLRDCGTDLGAAEEQLARCRAVLARWTSENVSDVMEARDCSRSAAMRIVESRIMYKKLKRRVERSLAILEVTRDACRRESRKKGG